MNDQQIKHWRAIAKVMGEDAGWRDAVNELALSLHYAGEQLKTPQSRLDLASSLSNLLAVRFSEETVTAGLSLTDRNIDDLVSALMISALDLADMFPLTGARQ